MFEVPKLATGRHAMHGRGFSRRIVNNFAKLHFPFKMRRRLLGFDAQKSHAMRHKYGFCVPFGFLAVKKQIKLQKK